MKQWLKIRSANICKSLLVRSAPLPRAPDLERANVFTYSSRSTYDRNRPDDGHHNRGSGKEEGR